MRSVEEEQGRAQSKPTHASGHSEQVRHRAAPTFQSGFLFPQGVFSFLCSPRTTKSRDRELAVCIARLRTRHRSTANWRATATMAFLRAAPVAIGPVRFAPPLARICRHLTTGL